MKQFEDLGRKVAETQDAYLDGAEENEGQLGAFLRELDESPRKSSPILRLGLPLVVAAATAVAAWFFFLPPAADLSFEAHGAAEPTGVGEWLASVGEEPVDITFSDGSRVLLEPGAAAVVEETRSNGATLALQRGNASVSVEHKDDTQWLVKAGPYTIRVVGTSFDVNWDADAGYFRTTLHEGRVIVDGPQLRSSELAEGETLESWVDESRTERRRERRGMNSGSDVAEPAEQPTPAERQAAAVPPTPREPQPAPTSEVSGAEEPPNWQALLDAGDLDAGLLVIEEAGWEAEIQKADEDSLWKLANAARKTSRGARAEQTLRAIRHRFPKSVRAARAAFELGRLVFARSPKDASNWFEAYMSETPQGPLAREAMGRLLECYFQAGQTSKAQEAAATYLKRYPEGPHAHLARRLLKNGSATE